MWDGNEKSIFTRPHDRQCLLLGVSTSVTLDQIHILSFVADSATADLHIAAKPHGYTGRHCISEDKSGKSAASPQVFLGAHVCSCLSLPPPPTPALPHISAPSSAASSNGKQILRDVAQSLIALSQVSTQRHQSCSFNPGKESKDLKLGLRTAARYHA